MKPGRAGLIGSLAQHLVCGVIAGVVFGILVLATDLGHIRTLLEGSSERLSTTVLMFFGLAVTFGSVAMGVGIMSLGRDDDADD